MQISKQYFENKIGKYFAIVAIAARSNLAYMPEVLGRQLFLAVILFVFLRLWKLTYANCGTNEMGGLSLPQMLWYFTAAEAIVLSETPITSIVDEDVRTGSLALKLTRPIAYPLYQLANALGERTIRLLTTLFIGAAICFLLVGELPITATGWMAFFITVPGALLIDFLGSFIVGLGAFWLENTNGLFFIYSKFRIILGGMIIPLSLLPEPFSSLIKLLPFASIVYWPTKQFVAPSYAGLIQSLSLQLIWIIICSLIVWQIYRIALRRIASNGG